MKLLKHLESIGETISKIKLYSTHNYHFLKKLSAYNFANLPIKNLNFFNVKIHK